VSRFAIVSGGGTGLGREIARALSSDGDRVVILGRRQDVLEKAAREINEALGASRVTYRRADLSKADEVAAVTAEITAGGQVVDVLVNCAGGRVAAGPGPQTLMDLSANWQSNFEGNVMTAVLLTHAMLPHLRHPGARVLAMSTNAVFVGREGAYAGAKSALHAWARSLVNELAHDGVTINLLAPGLCPAPDRSWSREHAERAKEHARRVVPMGRLGLPEEIAAAVRYLVSEDAGYVTGQILQVNGGMVLGLG
jgi:NAD(P)-dependent dehydrogenase (short-subunit alcohol dehydrogenase family)